jgi:4a-hydroxytetrahydrobiopterin dehydratase
MKRVKLDSKQIEAMLADAPGWSESGGKVTRTFEFPTYAAGVVFASAVAHIADSMDHHPDLLIGYRKVSVSVNTHDVGGISPWDFELARRVSGLVS